MPGVFVCAVLAALVSAPASAACRPEGRLERVTVGAVIDGDTVLLADRRRLRLIGINAPEAGRRDVRAEPLAAAARAALKELLPPDRRLWLQHGRERHDRYGRLLAHAFLRSDGASVEELLLRRGLAMQVAVPPNLALTACLEAAERSARAAGRGVWREVVFEPRLAASLTPSDAGFRRVTGQVRRVDESRRSWWLEFDGSFVVRLDKADLRHFGSVDAVAVRALLGQWLTLRGWVVDRGKDVPPGRKRLLLPLRHPLMLEHPPLQP